MLKQESQNDDFFRFPHTPHLVWLGDGEPRDDKVMSIHDANKLLSNKVVVEEKLDGANLGISLALDGSVRAQNRGQYLNQPFTGQFSRLPSWLAQKDYEIKQYLTPDLIFFGEWCLAKHSLDYDNLPDWFLLFDVYDKSVNKFWSTDKRNKLASQINLTAVPRINYDVFDLDDLKLLASNSKSSYRNGNLEGIVIRHEDNDWCLSRAKIVRSDFTQNIETHWRNKVIEYNKKP